ncbi:MAG: hypothetical protein ACP5LE_07675 [Thermoplasmata archaeon]
MKKENTRMEIKFCRFLIWNLDKNLEQTTKGYMQREEAKRDIYTNDIYASI